MSETLKQYICDKNLINLITGYTIPHVIEIINMMTSYRSVRRTFSRYIVIIITNNQLILFMRYKTNHEVQKISINFKKSEKNMYYNQFINNNIVIPSNSTFLNLCFKSNVHLIKMLFKEIDELHIMEYRMITLFENIYMPSYKLIESQKLLMHIALKHKSSNFHIYLNVSYNTIPIDFDIPKKIEKYATMGRGGQYYIISIHVPLFVAHPKGVPLFVAHPKGVPLFVAHPKGVPLFVAHPKGVHINNYKKLNKG
jgi:hypothetical protein